MKRIHIIGGKNHGKTTLVADLVQELSSRGYRVGTIKHTHHQHELDSPGKDSHRHRESGAAVVGILSRTMSAVFWSPESAAGSSSDDRYATFEQSFVGCHFIIVEGDTRTAAPKIEVWRKSLGTNPLAMINTSIIAVVTHDDCPGLTATVWSRADIAMLAEKVVEIAAAL